MDPVPQAPPPGGSEGAPPSPAPAGHSAPPPAGDAPPPAGEPVLDLTDLDNAFEVERRANPKFNGWSVKPEELKDLPPVARQVIHNQTRDYTRKTGELAQARRELQAREERIAAREAELGQRTVQISKQLAAPDGKPPEGEPPDAYTDPDGRAAWFAKKAAFEFHQEQQTKAGERIAAYETQLAEEREKAVIEAWAEANPEVMQPANQDRIVAVINDTTLPLCTPQQAWELLQDEDALTPTGRAAIAKWTGKFKGMSPVEAWQYERSVVQKRAAPANEAHDRALELGKPRLGRPAVRPMPVTSDLAEVRKWHQEAGALADEALEELRNSGISA